MDEETLETSIATERIPLTAITEKGLYPIKVNLLDAIHAELRSQLEQVETVLLSAGSEGQTELLKLREDLQQVIQLTQESLLSLKKSKLLSFVDSTAGKTNGSSSTPSGDTSRDAPPFKPSLGQDASSSDRFDDEFAAFQAAIAEDDDVPPASRSVPSSVPPRDSVQHLNDATEDDDSDGADDEELEEDDISGTKCSVDYTEEWGGRRRHNAVVMCVEPRANPKEEASLRVLFCNPTTMSMKPCPYYLEGTCRFSTDDCRFSHGYVVRLSELHSFKEPDFSLLKLEASCLARYSDGVWYPASIQHIDEDRHQVVVQFESYGTTATLDIHSVLPSEQSQEPSPPLSPSSSDTDDSDNDTDVPSTSASRRSTDDESETASSVAWMPSGGGGPLGQWEAHTRGIGSRLMLKMGYEFGKGLGRHGEGRVEPVEAVIVPQGKSLDKCMELREMKKLGIVGKPKKKQKQGKGKGYHQHASLNGQHRKKENVFDFINRKLGGKKAKITELIQQNMDGRSFLEKEPSKDEQEEKPHRKLNIQLVRTQEDIRSTEKQLVRLRESLHRNQRDKLTASQIQGKIDSTEKLLHNLRSSERRIQGQQSSQKQHRKLTIF